MFFLVFGVFVVFVLRLFLFLATSNVFATFFPTAFTFGSSLSPRETAESRGLSRTVAGLQLVDQATHDQRVVDQVGALQEQRILGEERGGWWFVAGCFAAVERLVLERKKVVGGFKAKKRWNRL